MISFGKWSCLFRERAGNGFMDVYKRKYKHFQRRRKSLIDLCISRHIFGDRSMALVAVKINVSDKFYKAIFDIHICSDTVFLYAGGNDIVGGGRVFVWNILYKYYVLCRDYGDNSCDYKKYEMDGNSNKSCCVLIQLVKLRCKYFKRHTANSKRFPCNRYGGTGRTENYMISAEIPDCCCNGYSGVGYNVNR